MKLEHAEQIMREFCRENRIDLTKVQASDLAFVLAGYEVIPTGLRTHHLKGPNGEPETTSRYGQTIALTLTDLLEDMTAPFPRHRGGR